MKTIQIIDGQRQVVATAIVDAEGPSFGGAIDLADTPADVLELFQEFEEIVNGQMFSFLDDVENRIASLHLQALSNDGTAMPLTNLQVFPTTGKISFSTRYGCQTTGIIMLPQ